MINAIFRIGKVERNILNNAAGKEVSYNAIIIIRLTRDSFDLFPPLLHPAGNEERRTEQKESRGEGRVASVY